MCDDSDDLWRDFTDEEMEWYRYWFEFLKLSDKSEWSLSVANDFDSSYFIDEHCSFEGWWPNHQYLFRKFKPPTLQVITSDEHYEACRDDGSCPDMPVITLLVPMWATKRELRADFEEFLKKYHTGKAGRPKFDGTSNVYNFSVRPDSDVLKKALAVYKMRVEPGNQNKKWWEIEEAVSKETPLINTERSNTYRIFNCPKPTPGDIEAWRSNQCLTVLRYWKCSLEILSNVVKGDFPVYTLNPKESDD